MWFLCFHFDLRFFMLRWRWSSLRDQKGLISRWLDEILNFRKYLFLQNHIKVGRKFDEIKNIKIFFMFSFNGSTRCRNYFAQRVTPPTKLTDWSILFVWEKVAQSSIVWIISMLDRMKSIKSTKKCSWPVQRMSWGSFWTTAELVSSLLCRVPVMNFKVSNVTHPSSILQRSHQKFIKPWTTLMWVNLKTSKYSRLTEKSWSHSMVICINYSSNSEFSVFLFPTHVTTSLPLSIDWYFYVSTNNFKTCFHRD